MAAAASKTSGWDTVRLQFFLGILTALGGLVAPNRLFVPWLSRWDAARSTLGFLGELREKYRADHLWVWFPFGRTLLVLNRESMDALLASDKNAADPAIKKFPLSRFVPDALVISSGDEWLDRRPFNESALGFGKLHGHGDAFAEIISREVDRLYAGPGRQWSWRDFQTLGERISHQVLLGAGEIHHGLSEDLARMVGCGNWFYRPRRSFSAFYGALERDLARHRALLRSPGGGGRPEEERVPADCLMHDSAALLEGGRASPLTQVPSQIGFWLFVLKDAVELHVARTLALIAVHPEAQERVRAEIRNASPLTAKAIDGLSFLEACLREQLRLWTPVPMLLRRAVEPFSLPGGIRVEAGQQILIHAGFYHRDARVFGAMADRFSPEAAEKGMAPVYVFSDGRQSCAGQFLARFVLKATLASMLARSRVELVGPALEPGRIPCSYDHFKTVLRPVAPG